MSAAYYLFVTIHVLAALFWLGGMFFLGPAAGHAQPGSPRALALRKHAAHLARANALLGIIVVIAAVRLARS